MSWLPVSLNCQNKMCFIVGGGEVAFRKFKLLIQFEAKIAVLAPTLADCFSQPLAQGQFEYIAADHQALVTHCQDCLLIIAATDDEQVNAEISNFAQQRGILVNVVDNIALSTYMTPAIVNRYPVTVAISTAGTAPMLATTLREKIEQLLPINLGSFIQQFKVFRQKINHSNLLPAIKRSLQKSVLLKFLAKNHELQSEQSMQALLSASAEKIETLLQQPCGEVKLVGAGPGDPELITLKALQALQAADVILYDNLANTAILQYARRDADQHYVGKKLNETHWTQAKINDLIKNHADQGKMVVRLKGGDPLIFGRTHEEASFLAAHHIPFSIIPGVTAALGCAASLKISLTHPELAYGCTFVTAHLRDKNKSLNWKLLSQSNKTLVFYMGATKIKEVCHNLLMTGLRQDTPMIIIEKGTLPEEKIYSGSVKYFQQQAEQLNIQRPALLMIGDALAVHNAIGGD